MAANLGERLQSVRKRRGLTQKELAKVSGVSVSLIRKIEQGDIVSTRLETLRKLAIGLRIRTTALRVNRDTPDADRATVDLWTPVRRALTGQDGPVAMQEAATLEGVQAACDALQPLTEGHHYREIAAILPQLLRDAESLTGSQGRAIRSRVLNLTGWALTMNNQFDAAAMTLDRAIDASVDRGNAAIAVTNLVWANLRQGRLAEAQELAVRWADDIEPRFSHATAAQLALWGRLWLYMANATVRDNAPGATEDALSLARAAAERLGCEFRYDRDLNSTFGPFTVAQIMAECAVITEQPGKVLSIAETMPNDLISPIAAGRLRHRLDVANAYTQLQQYGEATRVIQEVRATAPEWIAQQRYARC